jgi:hypothetical protein
MRNSSRFIVPMTIFIIAFSMLFSCGKPKEGKIEVTEQTFSIRKDSPNAYVMDAKGKVRNVGEVDVKNVVVTGSCPSCDEALAPGRWMGPGQDKTPDQKCVINYIPAGQEQEFSFKGVAFIYNLVPEEPQKKPEIMKVVVESFEVVE